MSQARRSSPAYDSRAVAVAQCVDQRRDVHRLDARAAALAGARARVLDELPDDFVDALDVGAHRRLFLVAHPRELDLHAQPGQRGADVVRDARERDRAIGLERGEVCGHRIEPPVHLGDLGWAVLGQRSGRRAGAHAAQRLRERGERAVDQPADQEAAHQRHRDRERTDQPPGRTRLAGPALQARGQPVAVAVDVEADPERPLAVHPARDARALAEKGAQPALEQLRVAAVRQGFDAVAGFEQRDPHAFVACQFVEQRAASLAFRTDQRRAGEVHHRGDLPGQALLGRGAVEGANHLPGRGQAEQHQRGDQQEGPPEQADPQHG